MFVAERNEIIEGSVRERDGLASMAPRMIDMAYPTLLVHDSMCMP